MGLYGEALLTTRPLQIDRYAQGDLKKGLHLYGTPGNVGLTNAWSIIQTDVRGRVDKGVGGPACGAWGRRRGGWGVLDLWALDVWRGPLSEVPPGAARSSAAAASPTTRTGSRSTMPRACLTPAAWSSVRAAGCMHLAPGGRR